MTWENGWVDYERLEPNHAQLAVAFLGSYKRLRVPDFVIAPGGDVSLYRWYMVPRNPIANAYFHIQVQSDPDRPLHDHYYDNQSVILAGGYDEELGVIAGGEIQRVDTWRRNPGDVIHRRAEEPHRLILPAGVPYSMSLFTTGPRRREWGFYYPDGWRHYADVTEVHDGVSVHKELTP